ncbi:MAG: DUF935 family protein [Muribaculaceae bacterium]
MSRKKKNIEPASSPSTSVVVNDFTLVSPDRNRKDISTLKSALLRAESIQLPNRVRLYDLYHDLVTLDGHLSGIIDKRVKASVNKHIYFEDAAGHRVDALDKLITSAAFKKVKQEIVLSEIWGISGLEFLRGANFDFVKIPRKHIRPEVGEITLSQYANNGISYADNPDVWVIGDADNLGVLLRCSMYALYKRSGLGDFAQYVEIFGQPVRIIYYDTYDTKTRDELKKMAESAGSSLVMMIPKQATFQMLDGKTSNGTGELQLGFLGYCNQEMSVAVLGNSETTLSSKSSGYAQSETHADQQLEITKDDLDLLINSLNSPKFLSILLGYGYPVAGGKFVVERDINLEELSKRLAIDKEVASRVPIADDYWYDTYNMPKPDNYDELKAAQEEQRQATLDAMNNKKTNEDEPEDKKSEKSVQSVGKKEPPNKKESEKSVQSVGKKEKGKKEPDKSVGKKLADLFDFFGVAPKQ